MTIYTEIFTRPDAEAFVRYYYHFLPSHEITTESLLGRYNFLILDRILENVLDKHQENVDCYVANSIRYNVEDQEFTVTISFAE